MGMRPIPLGTGSSAELLPCLSLLEPGKLVWWQNWEAGDPPWVVGLGLPASGLCRAGFSSSLQLSTLEEPMQKSGANQRPAHSRDHKPRLQLPSGSGIPSIFPAQGHITHCLPGVGRPGSSCVQSRLLGSASSLLETTAPLTVCAQAFCHAVASSLGSLCFPWLPLSFQPGTSELRQARGGGQSRLSTGQAGAASLPSGALLGCEGLGLA